MALPNNAHQFSHRNRRWAGPLLAIALFFFTAASSVLAQTEDGVKAAFVYNFAKFTNWPTNAFASSSAPVLVGFVGADALADTFETIVAGKNVNGHAFSIRRYPAGADVHNCQILYIGDPGQATAVLNAVQGKPILTIGDSDVFASSGGMVKLFRVGSRIRFDLDFEATQAARLKLDARVCQLAENLRGK